MAAAAFRRVFAEMVHGQHVATQLVANAVERAHQRAHVVRRVFVSAREGARDCVDGDKAKLAETRAPDQGNQTIDVASLDVAEIDCAWNGREGNFRVFVVNRAHV